MRAEVEFLRAVKADVVVGDVPALAFESANQAGIVSMAVANFGWDWVLDYYAQHDSRWHPVISQYQQAYGKCDVLMRLPFHESCQSFANIKDASLLVRRVLAARQEIRKRLGWAEDQKVVLLSFGGFVGGDLGFSDCDAAGDFLTASFEPKPSGYRGPWQKLDRDLGFRSVDLVAACDAVISKPGYGIISECLAYSVPLLLLPRRNYPESAILLGGLSNESGMAEMPEQDFFEGRWKEHLDRLRPNNFSSRPERQNSDERIAQEILDL